MHKHVSRRYLKPLRRRYVRPLRRRYVRPLRRARKRLSRQYLKPLGRRLKTQSAIAPAVRRCEAERRMYRTGWKRRAGTPLRADIRTLGSWPDGGQRVALRNYHTHPAFWTYRTDPPVRYVPSGLAELDHWINFMPEHAGPGEFWSTRRGRRRGRRPHILEVDHWLWLTNVNVFDWEGIVAQREAANARLRHDACVAVITLSGGLVRHSQQFLAEDVWSKLEHAFPAYPCQPPPAPRGDAFTILAIGNRFSDKGIPEVLRAFSALRERHGPRLRMVLVSSAVPPGWALPNGTTVYDTPRMSSGLKARVFGSADAFVLPCYMGSVATYPEACAFGVPTVATRLPHHDDFVLDGRTGYLVDSPIVAFSEGFGTRWRRWGDFDAEVDAMRQSRRLDPVVDDLVDRLELMVSDPALHARLRAGARQLHSERFSPQARNAKLRAIYRLGLPG